MTKPSSIAPTLPLDEALIPSIFQAVVDGIVIIDVAGSVVAANPAIETLFGYAPEELVGRNVSCLMTPEHSGAHNTYLKNYYETRQAKVIGIGREVQGRRKDGSPIDIELSVSEVWLQGKRFFTGFLRDVTQRKQAQARLFESLEDATHYKRFFEMANSMPAITGFDGYFKRLNDTWSKVLGYAREELLSRPFIEFVHEDDREATQAEAARLVEPEHRSAAFVNRYRCKDGSYVWLSWNAIADHQTQLFYAVAHDITELMRTRARLQKSEDLLRDTSHLTGVGGWEVDLETMTPHWSEEVYRIHEVPPDYQPNLEEAISFYAPEARPVVAQAVQLAIETGADWDLQLPFITAQGNHRWVRAMGKPVQRDGKTVALRGAFQDITHQKVVDRMKDEFISVVSHELRTPLTAIRGSLRLIEGGIAGQVSEQTAELIRIADANAERLVRLISDVLDIEKIEAGRMELDLERLEVSELLYRAAASLESLAEAAQVEMLREVEAELYVVGDADRLVQVLTNLLSNAIKHSPEGGTILLSARPERSAAAGRPELRIAVHDEGPGVPHDQQSVLFERFRQLDASDSRRKGGTGLGLAICKALVGQHGGDIGVQSAPGEGATFWFTLPTEP